MTKPLSEVSPAARKRIKAFEMGANYGIESLVHELKKVLPPSAWGDLAVIEDRLTAGPKMSNETLRIELAIRRMKLHRETGEST